MTPRPSPRCSAPTPKASEPVDSPLARTFMQARHYTPGPRTRGPVLYLVIHDMEAPEGPNTAENVGRWFAGPDSTGSTQYGVDNNSAVGYVHERDIAWGAPGLNHNGIHLELAGYARQTAAQWADLYSLQVFRIAIPLARDICQRNHIPMTYRDATQLRAQVPGITTHRAGSQAFKPGGHTDPGPDFPMTWFIRCVNGTTPPPLTLWALPTGAIVRPLSMTRGERVATPAEVQDKYLNRGWVQVPHAGPVVY